MEYSVRRYLLKEKRMKSSALFVLIFVINSIFIQSNAREIKGEKMIIGKGYARTYIHLDSKNRPTVLGILMSKDALEGLPHEDTNYSLKFPASVIPPYREIVVGWNPEGHEPPGVYDIPHFDFHFYTIDKDDREAITCIGSDASVCTKVPHKDFLPKFYIPTPAGVPMMGWHWLDSRSPELNGKRFTSTFIYGYYDGEMIFVEPMITREFMLSCARVNHVLPLPHKVASEGYYPRKYTLNYNAKEKVYRLELKNFKSFLTPLDN